MPLVAGRGSGGRGGAEFILSRNFGTEFRRKIYYTPLRGWIDSIP